MFAGASLTGHRADFEPMGLPPPCLLLWLMLHVVVDGESSLLEQVLFLNSFRQLGEGQRFLPTPVFYVLKRTILKQSIPKEAYFGVADSAPFTAECLISANPSSPPLCDARAIV